MGNWVIGDWFWIGCFTDAIFAIQGRNRYQKALHSNDMTAAEFVEGKLLIASISHLKISMVVPLLWLIEMAHTNDVTTAAFIQEDMLRALFAHN